MPFDQLCHIVGLMVILAVTTAAALAGILGFLAIVLFTSDVFKSRKYNSRS